MYTCVHVFVFELFSVFVYIVRFSLFVHVFKHMLCMFLYMCNVCLVFHTFLFTSMNVMALDICCNVLFLFLC